MKIGDMVTTVICLDGTIDSATRITAKVLDMFDKSVILEALVEGEWCLWDALESDCEVAE